MASLVMNEFDHRILALFFDHRVFFYHRILALFFDHRILALFSYERI